jgi:hypothetical protein
MQLSLILLSKVKEESHLFSVLKSNVLSAVKGSFVANLCAIETNNYGSMVD